MKEFRSNRVLAVALVLSLLTHVILAMFAHGFHRIEARDEIDIHPTTISYRPKPPPPTPRPTPPPKTHAQPQQTQTVAYHPTVHTPTVTHTNVGPQHPVDVATASPVDMTPGPETITPGTASPQPTPTPTPRPQCSTPYAAAHALTKVDPETPEDAAGFTGTAQVQITLSQSGSVVAANIFQSAGNVLLDRAAVTAAKSSTYAPEIRDCHTVGGTYIFTATFSN